MNYWGTTALTATNGTSPFPLFLPDAFKDSAQNDTQFPRLTLFHVENGSTVGPPVIAHHRNVANRPIDGDPVFIVNIHKLLQFIVRHLGVIAIGDLQWSFLVGQQLDAGPGIEPHPVICHRGKQQVLVQLRAVFVDIAIEFGLHIPTVSGMRHIPLHLQSTFVGHLLCGLRVLSVFDVF